jgi:hypothetical protein
MYASLEQYRQKEHRCMKTTLLMMLQWSLISHYFRGGYNWNIAFRRGERVAIMITNFRRGKIDMPNTSSKLKHFTTSHWCCNVMQVSMSLCYGGRHAVIILSYPLLSPPATSHGNCTKCTCTRSNYQTLTLKTISLVPELLVQRDLKLEHSKEGLFLVWLLVLLAAAQATFRCSWYIQ